MSVGRDIVLAAVRVVDRDIARVAVLRPQLITAVQRVVHAAEFEVKPVRELVIRRVMIVYATVIATTIGRCPCAFKIPRIVTCNTTESELNTLQSNVARCCTPEPQASTHDTRTKNCLPNTHTFTPQVSNLESDTPDSTRALVDALKLLQPIRPDWPWRSVLRLQAQSLGVYFFDVELQARLALAFSVKTSGSKPWRLYLCCKNYRPDWPWRSVLRLQAQSLGVYFFDVELQARLALAFSVKTSGSKPWRLFL
ncbi:unnamed protein product [Danaus chrysippus]|uniref:(African queen) hypothetical protein n=1 Tax=Danaus chrysippus TaxID=151541 RepID=A0A8J2VTZ0_9NEOP|nr:unnamed protein product [Danaus chrysippus]